MLCNHNSQFDSRSNTQNVYTWVLPRGLISLYFQLQLPHNKLELPHHLWVQTYSQLRTKPRLHIHVYVLLAPQTPKFQSVHIETCSQFILRHVPAPNEPKITLNNTRSKVSHICSTTTPESQTSIHFALRPTIFELQATCGKCTERLQNDNKHKTKGMSYMWY